jgi:hypothetical protein
VSARSTSTAAEGHEGDENDGSRPRLDLARLKQAKLKDYAIRFTFGGAVSVIAALLGYWITPRFGGIFTAFPAILLASLTLIGEHDGREQSAEGAEGGVAGALALVACAFFIALTVTRLPGAVSLVLALLLWLALALAGYALGVRLGWLRTRARNEAPKQRF